MINIEEFALFLNNTFGESIIYFDRFKPELLFFEIDCLKDSDQKLSIDLSPDAVRLSSVDKSPGMDFSLHDHYFTSSIEAKNYLLEIYKTGIYISYNNYNPGKF